MRNCNTAKELNTVKFLAKIDKERNGMEKIVKDVQQISRPKTTLLCIKCIQLTKYI